MINILKILVLILLILLEIKIINLLSLKLFNKNRKIFNVYLIDIVNLIMQILLVTLLVYKYLDIMEQSKNNIIYICIATNIISIIIWYFFIKKKNINLTNLSNIELGSNNKVNTNSDNNSDTKINISIDKINNTKNNNLNKNYYAYNNHNLIENNMEYDNLNEDDLKYLNNNKDFSKYSAKDRVSNYKLNYKYSDLYPKFKENSFRNNLNISDFSEKIIDKNKYRVNGVTLKEKFKLY